MKKILFFAVLAVAFAGFAANTAGIAHAQTVTSSESNNATLEQQLQVAKATLLNLEMQQGMIPQGDDQLSNGATPSVSQAQPSQTISGLSLSEISGFETTLSTLVGTLSQLDASLNANPNMSASQLAALQTTLGGMQNTLVAMASTIAADKAGAPVAMTTPAAPAATNATPAPVAQGATPSAPVAVTTPATSPAVTTAPTTAVTSNPVQTTAQASSIWSFTKDHWPAIVIILLVIVILAILFWPENNAKETVTSTQKKTTTTVSSSVSAAVASAPTATTTTTTAKTVTTAPADSTKIA